MPTTHGSGRFIDALAAAPAWRRLLLVTVVIAVVAVPSAVVAATLTAHRFQDVSDTSSHAAGIGWLAESGVTAGCRADEFCPTDEVTRAQMATFMYRLSGNDPAVGPVVDAATVQGVAITEVGSAIEDATCPANQVVAGFAGGTIVCRPVTSLSSADGANTVTATTDAITISGPAGTITLDVTGITIEAFSQLTLEGSGVDLTSSGLLDLDASLTTLNGGCAPVARFGDSVVAAGGSGTIVSGSGTVFSC